MPGGLFGLSTPKPDPRSALLYFNGYRGDVSSHVSAQRFCTGDPDMFQPLTLCCWARPATTGGVGAGSWTRMSMISKISFPAVSTTDWPIDLYWDVTGTQVSVTLSPGSDFSTSTTLTSDTVTNNIWHFVGMVYDGAAIWLYVDGKVKTTACSYTLQHNIQPWTFGNSANDNTGGASAAYVGWLYDPRIYNVAKSMEQLAAIHRGRDDQTKLYASLLSYQVTSPLPPPFV